MNVRETFSQRLRQRRLELGLTQKALAAQVYIAWTAISSYERGAGTPCLETLPLLSKALRCSIDWLVGLTNSKGGIR